MWWYVAIFVVGLLVAYSQVPKAQNQKSAAFSDVQAPTAEEGREIPVLFGTMMIRNPNIVWYGNFSAAPVEGSSGSKK